MTLQEVLAKHRVPVTEGAVRGKLRQHFGAAHTPHTRWRFGRGSPEHDQLLNLLGVGSGLLIGKREPSMGLPSGNWTERTLHLRNR